MWYADIRGHHGKEFLKTQLEKALRDVEELKDKVRANGNGHG
jgi:hypothetical protein